MKREMTNGIGNCTLTYAGDSTGWLVDGQTVYKYVDELDWVKRVLNPYLFHDDYWNWTNNWFPTITSVTYVNAEVSTLPDGSQKIRSEIVGMRKDKISLTVEEGNIVHLIYSPDKDEDFYSKCKIERFWQVEQKKEIKSIMAKYKSGILEIKVLFIEKEKKKIPITLE
jgi:HSP20 family molecular chaperone IbpA